MTTSNSRPPELASRLAGLSPEKQALLARKLADRSLARGALDAERIPLRAGAGPAPLSYAQELLWLHEQMTPGTATYNVPLARRVRGPLDFESLGRAFGMLVERHESLRTRFVEVDGVPRQFAVAPRAIDIELHDLRGNGSGGHEAEALQLIEDASARPFDLADGTFPRVLAVRLGAEEALLLVVVHHVVFDGGSIPVFFRDLAACYEAALTGAKPALSPLPIQLADFAAWERGVMDAARLAPVVGFWREHLAGAAPGVELTPDFPRPPGTTGPGARYAITLDAAARDAMRELAASHSVTPFVVLLAAFTSLLARYSGQTDVVIGTAVAGRSRAGTEGLVGYLANTLPVRSRFDNDPTFAELLKRVNVNTLQMLEHQEVPYEKLIRELRLGGNDLTLFRVMFTFNDSARAAARLGTAKLESVGVDLGAAKFDLTVSASELPDGIRVAVEYRRDLFRDDTIERFVLHLGVLLEGAARAPHTSVSRLPLLTTQERERVLVAFNDTRRKFPVVRTLDDLVKAQVERTPGACAVHAVDGDLTFDQLDARAALLAGWLRANGAGPGTLVAVLMERSCDMVVAMLGALKSGAAYVPLDPEYPAERLAYMIRDAGAPVVLVQARFRTLVPNAVALAVDADWGQVVAARPVMPNEGTHGPDDPAYVIYTSGSTGAPKGVVVPHRAIVNHMQWMQRAFPIVVGDAVLQKTPVSFDASVWEFWAPLTSGARLVMAEPGVHREPGRIVAAVRRDGISVLQLVPSVLAALLDTPGFGACTSLRRVYCGGEPLPPELVTRLVNLLDVELHNLYGPAEATIDATVWSAPRRGDIVALKTVPIGRPIDNVTAYVLSPAGEPLPVGVPGELWLGGAGVALGYHARPALTAERFAPDPFAPTSSVDGRGRVYRTADRVRFLPDGQLEYLGRLDEQVKVRGVRIELGEIEAALLAIPGVAAAAASTRDDGAYGTRLIAYVVPSRDSALDRDVVAAALARTMPSTMQPSAIVLLDVMPLTPSGKLDRRALPAPTYEIDGPVIAPRDDVEAVIAEVWRDVLGRDTVSVEAGFMELGGHSLLATRISAQVTKIFRTPLPLRRFFEAPTVAGNARALVTSERKPGQTAAIAGLYRKVQQMTPAQRKKVLEQKASL